MFTSTSVVKLEKYFHNPFPSHASNVILASIYYKYHASTSGINCVNILMPVPQTLGFHDKYKFTGYFGNWFIIEDLPWIWRRVSRWPPAPRMTFGSRLAALNGADVWHFYQFISIKNHVFKLWPHESFPGLRRRTAFRLK